MSWWPTRMVVQGARTNVLLTSPKPRYWEPRSSPSTGRRTSIGRAAGVGDRAGCQRGRGGAGRSV